MSDWQVKIRRPFGVVGCWLGLLVLIGTAQAQTWLRVEASGPEAPPPRTFAVAIYDPRGERMLLFGGRGPDGDLNDLWSLNLEELDAGAKWTRIETEGVVPAARFTHNAVYDPAAHQMLVWAGRKVDSAGSAFFNDVWFYDIGSNSWTELETGDPRPNTRYGTATVFDPVAGNLVTFAGFTDAGRFEDTWRFDPRGAVWTEISPAEGNPGRRCLHSASYDAARHRMIIYGGQRSGPLDDIWALDLATQQWAELGPAERQGGRFYTANVYDAGNDRVLIFGGNLGSGGLSNELWSFDLEGEAWSLLEPMGEPPTPREGATGLYLEEEGRMVVFGGTAESHTDELWVLDDLDPPTAVSEPVANGLPRQFVLHQNYPNPFNAGTTISFELSEPSEVRVQIHDQLGRKVRTLATGFRGAGTHRILWDGTDDAGQPAGSGTYFYQLDAVQSVHRKLLILR
jgi:hypothetical protein